MHQGKIPDLLSADDKNLAARDLIATPKTPDLDTLSANHGKK